MIDQGPFLGFARNINIQLFTAARKNIEKKVASVKGPRKTERKGAANKIENG